MLSNLYLKELDELILAKYHSVRFADDILIMCESYEVCVEAMAECKNYLRQIGLDVHNDKSRIVEFFMVNLGYFW